MDKKLVLNSVSEISDKLHEMEVTLRKQADFCQLAGRILKKSVQEMEDDNG